jgi:hypothetical protein
MTRDGRIQMICNCLRIFAQPLFLFMYSRMYNNYYHPLTQHTAIGVLVANGQQPAASCRSLSLARLAFSNCLASLLSI